MKGMKFARLPLPLDTNSGFKSTFRSLQSWVKKWPFLLRSYNFSFAKVTSDFTESVFWITLSLLCRDFHSCVGVYVVKYLENTFLLSNYFVSNLLFWWHDFLFWLQIILKLYSFIQSWIQNLLNFSCNFSNIGSGCCLSQLE